MDFDAYKGQKTERSMIKMATREENLKKINEELEKLSDEELDNVAGGTYLESADDAKKFKEIGINVYESEILGVPVLQGAQFTKLREAFNKFDVTIKDNGGIINANEYYIGGNKVSREDAWKHINAQLNK